MTTETLSVLHGPREAYSGGARIEELVARTAERCGEAVALRWRDTEVTYAELVADAAVAASALAAAGVGPGDIVAIRAPRTPRLVAVLLGVLRTGAAYACAPPDWPLDRVRQLIERTGAKLLLSHEPFAGVSTLDIDALPGAAPVPAHGLDGTAPFCVFLTSGSTGVPKAALAPHSGVARTALDRRHGHDGRIVSLQQANPAWDVFAFELWVPLIKGGTAVLHDSGHLSGPQVRARIGEGVTLIAMASTLFNALVDDDVECFAGARVLFVGGERASAAHVKRCLRAHPGLRVVNAYGPVENTVSTTAFSTTDPDFGDEVPIGTPSVNTSVYLLDEDRRIVPAGQAGEIVTVGDGVCFGYVGDEAETAKRFATLAFDGVPRRAYFTGDLARLDEAGRLVFVGRRDRQLKVRGVRIEAEEVERIVEAVPGVTAGVVVPLPFDGAVKTSLAAFYVGEGVPPELVRKAVAAVLPAGFVPDVVVAVAEFPKLPNGKLDQRALAEAAGAGSLPSADDGVGLEATLREVASEVLGYRVGVADDIFDRGATSLTAIRISTRIGALFGRLVVVPDILAARTPRAIAAAVAAAPALELGNAGHHDPGPETAYEPDHVPFTVAEFWHAQKQAGHLEEAVVPVIYRVRGAVDRAALGRALDHVVARHEVLRARFAEGGRTPKVRIHPAAELAGLLTDRPAATTVDAVRDACVWVMRPFDLGADFPIRAAYYPVSATESVLAVGIHHISFDGWSGQVFAADLVRAYDAFVAGRPGLADWPGSYYRVSAEQWEQYRDRYPLAVYTKQTTMADAPELRFPLPGPRPWGGPAAEVVLDIDEVLLPAVGRAAAAVGGTVMAIFYTAYVLLLRELTGEPSPAVALPTTGRFTEEAGDVIGCLASMVPMRPPAGIDDPAELAAAAARQLQEVMRPPLVPLTAMMPAIPEGHQRHPLLQAYLLQEEMPPAAVRFGDARAELVRVPPRNALPEITLELWPHPAVGGVLRYRTDAIGEEQARGLADRLIDHVTQVVRALEENCDI
ncbi:AMP-binding protein [Amycolatopsis mediterranei]|uniref:AMP-binding protein n=1 Tax=Amycolatopsis mediterranei TaxID=33910 RepID=UPI00038DC4AE|nr:AMP-binding protein [Amycolatopsis mediterranei]AGT86008.1 amino acid adenylation and condensation domain-containing protein [Amycolatopsis mediterranei RB]